MAATPSNADKIEHGYMDLEAHDAAVNGGAPVNTSRFAIKSPAVREACAEFVAVFVMMSFGLAATCQSILSDSKYGDFTQIVFGWGIGVLFGIHIAGGVSGSHLNPAITTTAALFGMFPWKKVPTYVAVQTLASYLAALWVYVLYRPLLNVVDPERQTTQAIFATYPNEYVSNFVAFLTEMFATALLVGGIFAVLDQHNRPASPFSAPSAVALLVVGIGMAFSVNTGCAINPARDFGPRLMMLTAGWGSHVFTLNHYYFWVPIVGPTVGGALGGLVYVSLVGHHHPHKAPVVRRAGEQFHF
ncbi:putative aquaporin [Phytophthora cinnamomi]|uniref:putative aquaporin n=1 Tax=Phytophthora cinnamomi TaxID=4785 RepID=UPI00355940F1|nr:putative aquaporin [Phytophthora cinnamomi]